jgi:hypothetical protein
VDWRCAAISHYSFLYHWRQGTLGDFMFPLWDFHYMSFKRWSINFFIFNSSDLPPPPLPADDEVGCRARKLSALAPFLLLLFSLHE